MFRSRSAHIRDFNTKASQFLVICVKIIDHNQRNYDIIDKLERRKLEAAERADIKVTAYCSYAAGIISED